MPLYRNFITRLLPDRANGISFCVSPEGVPHCEILGASGTIVRVITRRLNRWSRYASVDYALDHSYLRLIGGKENNRVDR